MEPIVAMGLPAGEGGFNAARAAALQLPMEEC
jgi:hypothetical protein